MAFSFTEISAYIGSFFWPFVRIGAALGVAPVFGARTVPVRTRLFFAFLITMVIVPLIPAAPKIDPLTPDGVLIAIQQLLIGLSMGFALLMVFAAFILGGQVIAMQMGLGFASLIDPQNGVQTPVISQLYVLLSTLIFLSLDGHLVLITVLAESFQTMPIAPQALTSDSMWLMVSWGREIFASAILIAMPVITTLLLVNIAFGVMTRAAPQLNIFAVGFPVIMTAGFILIFITLDGVQAHLTRIVDGVFEMLKLLVSGTI